MRNKNELKNILARINGKGYKAYKDIEGDYDFGDFILIIDHVQGDPFALPSRLRIKVEGKASGFPPDTFMPRIREIALRDFITRSFWKAIRRYSLGSRGTGRGGEINIDRTGQEILERTSAFISESRVEIRFTLGLPAFGRRIASRHAEEMLLRELPRIVRESAFFKSLNCDHVYRHIEAAEDAESLRSQLKSHNLVAFIADGSLLPRASGVDSRPLEGAKVIPFSSPESLRCSFQLPNHGSVSGMGIPAGITLIVGGGYHGKSTLLKALQSGIYNHIPGDGRELTVSVPEAVKIRAEDGRRIEKVDISPFINNLPLGRDTRQFSSEDASGSTSQAANIIEVLEAGGEVLLIDEDTSATNFMIRDHRMQELVTKENEPITPFIDKVRQLYEERGVSSILVLGGSGDYFDVADRVICMVEYRPHDVSSEARAVANRFRNLRFSEGGESFGFISGRIPHPGSLDPRKGKKAVKIAAKGIDAIQFGIHDIDLTQVEQLADSSQTRAIGDAILYAKKYMDGHRSLKDIIEIVLSDIESGGLDVLHSQIRGDYAEFRGLELAAAVNRLRTLRVASQI